jgi:hypothetical protein
MSNGAPTFYLWEVHDGVFRIGQIDGQTGDVIPGSQERLTIEYNRQGGYVSFIIPEAEQPPTIDQVGARSFHTPREDMEPQPTFCDLAGLYDFVDIR